VKYCAQTECLSNVFVEKNSVSVPWVLRSLQK
jgi:hypothetical protein